MLVADAFLNGKSKSGISKQILSDFYEKPEKNRIEIMKNINGK